VFSGILNELTVNDAIVPEIWAFEIANSIFVSHKQAQKYHTTADS
jgi:hypothetical protein